MAASPLEADLKKRWLDVCKVLEVDRLDKLAVDRWWQVILARYKHKSRAYHTLDHLGELFELYDKHAEKISDSTAMILAIFFHDIVYDATQGSPQNEKDSAVLFERFGDEAIPAGDPPGRAKGELVGKVSRWIVQTAHHGCAPNDEPDCRFFMDFDMAVLGKPWEEYVVYTEKIRKEYIHLPEPVYWTGRSRFLLATASGPSLYATEEFRTSHGEQSKANCEKEAAVLSKNLDEKCTSFARFVASLGLRFKWAPKAFQALLYLKRLRKPKFLVPFLVILFVLLRFKLLILYLAIMVMLAAMCYVVKLVISSPIIKFPYQVPSARKGVVVIAGSYNPPHLGHIEMIKHLAQAHTSVHVVIGVNPNKTYEVNAWERQELIKAMIKDLNLKGVKVVVWSGIIFQYARSKGAKIMYRGIRSWAQDGRAEKKLECQNIFYQLLSGYVRPIPTVYLQGNPELADVSSTVLRSRITKGEDISDLVPKSCVEAVVRAYREQAEPKAQEDKKAD